MALVETQNINLNDFEKPIIIINKIYTLHEQLPHILDDFKKYYIFYNKNPEYPEYSQMFDNLKSNLNTINSNLFTLSNSIDVNTQKVSKKMFQLNVLIKKEKIINRKLKQKSGFIEQQIDSVDEMISDYNQIYDEGYLRNWALFLSIIASGVIMSVVYKK